VNASVVFTYARMNPPTEGHRELFDQVNAVAASREAVPYIILSHTTGNSKNPLTALQKLHHVRNIVGVGPTYMANSELPSIVQWLTFLNRDMGYKDLTIVCGADRETEFKAIVNRCHGKDFTFWKYEYVVGQRHDGVSGTRAREVAASLDFEAFRALYPNTREKFVRELFIDLVASQSINRPKSRVRNSGTTNQEKSTG